MEQEKFLAVSGWRRAAIMELMRVRDFKPDFQWIAPKLCLTPNETGAFVERLVGLAAHSSALARFSQSGIPI